ncbi:MAG: hypothetical protein O2904_03860, partial [bacterium]|nr:hypothetical protein [bacterium]
SYIHMNLSEGVSTVLEPAKKLLWEAGFSCNVLLGMKMDQVERLQCVVDCRGLRGQEAANERAAQAKNTIAGLCSEHGIKLNVLSTGNTF